MWLALFIMWSGHGCSGNINKASDDWNLQFAKQALECKVQQQTATEADLNRLKHMRDQYNNDACGFNMSYVFLYALGGGLCYLTFANRPKWILKNWVDTGEFVLAEKEAPKP